MATFHFHAGSGSSSEFEDSSVWSAGGPPGTADLAVFGYHDPNNGVAFIDGDGTVDAMLFIGNYNRPPEFIFSGAITALSTLTVLASATVIAHGTLTTGNLRVTGQLDISTAAAANSTAVLDTQAAVAGGGVGQGGTINIDGRSVWANAGSATIGRSGAGVLEVLDSTATIGTSGSGDLRIATGHGSSGSVLLASSQLFVAGDVLVGRQGVGLLTVGADSTLTARGTLEVSGGSAVAVAGGTIEAVVVAVATGAMVSGQGVFGLGSTNDDLFTNNGTVRAEGDLLLYAHTIDGHGTLQVAAHGTLELGVAASSGQQLSFTGKDASIIDFSGFTSGTTVAGFSLSDTLSGFSDIASLGFDSASGILDVKHTGGAPDTTLHMLGNFTGLSFVSTDFSITLTQSAAHGS